MNSHAQQAQEGASASMENSPPTKMQVNMKISSPSSRDAQPQAQQEPDWGSCGQSASSTSPYVHGEEDFILPTVGVPPVLARVDTRHDLEEPSLEEVVLGWIHDTIVHGLQAAGKKVRQRMKDTLPDFGLPPKHRLRLRHLSDGRLLLVLLQSIDIRLCKSASAIAVGRLGQFQHGCRRLSIPGTEILQTADIYPAPAKNPRRVLYSVCHVHDALPASWQGPRMLRKVARASSQLHQPPHLRGSCAGAGRGTSASLLEDQDCCLEHEAEQRAAAARRRKLQPVGRSACGGDPVSTRRRVVRKVKIKSCTSSSSTSSSSASTSTGTSSSSSSAARKKTKADPDDPPEDTTTAQLLGGGTEKSSSSPSAEQKNTDRDEQEDEDDYYCYVSESSNDEVDGGGLEQDGDEENPRLMLVPTMSAPVVPRVSTCCDVGIQGVREDEGIQPATSDNSSALPVSGQTTSTGGSSIDTSSRSAEDEVGTGNHTTSAFGPLSAVLPASFSAPNQIHLQQDVENIKDTESAHSEVDPAERAYREYLQRCWGKNGAASASTAPPTKRAAERAVAKSRHDQVLQILHRKQTADPLLGFRAFQCPSAFTTASKKASRIPPVRSKTRPREDDAKSCSSSGGENTSSDAEADEAAGGLEGVRGLEVDQALPGPFRALDVDELAKKDDKGLQPFVPDGQVQPSPATTAGPSPIAATEPSPITTTQPSPVECDSMTGDDSVAVDDGAEVPEQVVDVDAAANANPPLMSLEEFLLLGRPADSGCRTGAVTRSTVSEADAEYETLVTAPGVSILPPLVGRTNLLENTLFAGGSDRPRAATRSDHLAGVQLYSFGGGGRQDHHETGGGAGAPGAGGSSITPGETPSSSTVASSSQRYPVSLNGTSYRSCSGAAEEVDDATQRRVGRGARDEDRSRPPGGVCRAPSTSVATRREKPVSDESPDSNEDRNRYSASPARPRQEELEQLLPLDEKTPSQTPTSHRRSRRSDEHVVTPIRRTPTDSSSNILETPRPLQDHRDQDTEGASSPVDEGSRSGGSPRINDSNMVSALSWMEAELPSCKGWLTKKAVTSGGTYQYQWRWTVLDRCVLSFWDTEEDWENGRPCEDQLNFFAVVKGSDRGVGAGSGGEEENPSEEESHASGGVRVRLRADASGGKFSVITPASSFSSSTRSSSLQLACAEPDSDTSHAEREQWASLLALHAAVASTLRSQLFAEIITDDVEDGVASCERDHNDDESESPEEQLRNVLRHSPFELLEDLFVEKRLCRACFDQAAYEMEVEDQSESCGGASQQTTGGKTHQLHSSPPQTRGEDAENSRLPPG